jgi:outer membrane receptor protein involved in Fe transport
MGLVAALGGRAIGEFVAGTSTYEVVKGYNAFDASVAYQLPWTAGVTVALKASNLLNTLHRELASQAAMGRLIVVRVHVAM